MVVNEALKLGILSWILDEDLKSALTSLSWSTFQVWLQANRGAHVVARRPRPSAGEEGPMPVSDREERSGSNNAPPPPSDDDDE